MSSLCTTTAAATLESYLLPSTKPVGRSADTTPCSFTARASILGVLGDESIELTGHRPESRSCRCRSWPWGHALGRLDLVQNVAQLLQFWKVGWKRLIPLLLGLRRRFGLNFIQGSSGFSLCFLPSLLAPFESKGSQGLHQARYASLASCA